MDTDLRSKLECPIVMIGLMGAGKTRIGRMLADYLGIPFVDSDDVITAREGLSIPEIFAQKGEAHFRAVERAAIADLLTGDPVVLSTGGGAVTAPDTADLIFSRALTIWLRADTGILVSRVAPTLDKRPLLQAGDPAEILRKLADQRDPLYARAAIHVESRDVPLEENLNSVVKALTEHLS